MVALFLFGVIFGAVVTEQPHYDYCKSIEFKSHACLLEKDLKDLGPKNDLPKGR